MLLLKEYDCLSLEVMFYIPALGATVFLPELVGNALNLIFTFHLSSPGEYKLWGS